MKECPFCNSQVPDVAHYCANCGKSFGAEEAVDAIAKAESAVGTHIETRYVPGHPGIAVVKIAGYCDHHHVNKLEMELATLRDEKPRIVVLDFSGTQGLCSMALSVIFAFVSDREGERENSTALVNLREPVIQAIDCLGITSILPIYATIKEAFIALQVG